MKETKIFFWLLGILIISCQTPHNNSVPPKISHSFQTFIRQFDHDTIFRKQHISDSLTILIKDLDENKTVIKKADSRPELPSFTQMNQGENGYKWEIIYKKDTVLYVQRGIDNGIYITYMFVKKNKDWFLVKIIDESD